MKRKKPKTKTFRVSRDVKVVVRDNGWFEIWQGGFRVDIKVRYIPKLIAALENADGHFKDGS